MEGWIRKIIVNQALGALQKRKQCGFEEYPENVFSVHPSDLETQDLLQLIDSLPIGYKTVFNLYAIEGYNHAEIAEMLGISEGTSKSQLSRARTFLQEKLQPIESKIL